MTMYGPRHAATAAGKANDMDDVLVKIFIIGAYITGAFVVALCEDFIQGGGD